MGSWGFHGFSKGFLEFFGRWKVGQFFLIGVLVHIVICLAEDVVGIKGIEMLCAMWGTVILAR